jgi:hypothetical protein
MDFIVTRSTMLLVAIFTVRNQLKFDRFTTLGKIQVLYFQRTSFIQISDFCRRPTDSSPAKRLGGSTSRRREFPSSFFFLPLLQRTQKTAKEPKRKKAVQFNRSFLLFVYYHHLFLCFGPGGVPTQIGPGKGKTATQTKGSPLVLVCTK